ncbi:hypothetical protein HID58_091428 [Brassica napus]|uniref:Uncharacterized protein n=1 Tax=Brassica napus TaxID=3708 RepID=A0ABQ7X255_BRANA|nr:hypothetical protein HID58_091428 [Brassica napus]
MFARALVLENVNCDLFLNTLFWNLIKLGLISTVDVERDWDDGFKRLQPTSNMGVFTAEMSSDYFFSFWGMAEARNASSALVLLSLAKASRQNLLYWYDVGDENETPGQDKREQGPFPGDSENKSGLPNPNASPFKSFSEIKAGLSMALLSPLQIPKATSQCKATSGSLPDLKGGRKMTSYTADATAENIGRRVKAMGLESVVVKWCTSRTLLGRLINNGCRLPRKRRSQQQPLLPDPSHFKVNPFGLLSSSIHGFAESYGNPLALYALESDPPLLLKLSTIIF